MPQRGEGPSHVAAGISLARATTAQGFPKVRFPPLGELRQVRLPPRRQPALPDAPPTTLPDAAPCYGEAS